MIAPHAIQRHPSNAQPRLRVLHSGCRRACWAMMMRQARRSSAIQHYTVRCGFLSQRSYVAPSRQRRSSSKRPRKELTYCPIYGFKSFLICAKELTPALFCCSVSKRFRRSPGQVEASAIAVFLVAPEPRNPDRAYRSVSPWLSLYTRGNPASRVVSRPYITSQWCLAIRRRLEPVGRTSVHIRYVARA